MIDVPVTALADSQTEVRKLLASAQKVSETLRRAADAQGAEPYALWLGAAELLAVELHAAIALQRARDAMVGVSPDDEDDEPHLLEGEALCDAEALEAPALSVDEDEP